MFISSIQNISVKLDLKKERKKIDHNNKTVSFGLKYFLRNSFKSSILIESLLRKRGGGANRLKYCFSRLLM